MAGNHLCRICLTNGDTINIFECNEYIERILLKYHLNYMKIISADSQVSSSIGNIKHICIQCWHKIDDFNKFCDEAEKIHRNYINTCVKKDVEFNAIIIDSTATSVPVTVECKPDINEDEIDEFSEIHTEVVFGIENQADDLNDQDFEDDSDDSSSESSDESICMQKKSPTKRRSSRNEASKAKKKTKIPKGSKNDRTSFWDHGEDENTKRMAQYFILKCEICAHDAYFSNFEEIQVHYRESHKTKGYLTCCSKKFRRMGRILQHCTWHENPEAFKCIPCNRCYEDNDRLTAHKVSKHTSTEQKQYQCYICNATFAKKHLLNTHLKHRHTDKEDRPFACTVEGCDARYVLAALLRLHVKKVHEEAHSRVCDICAKYFKCPESYDRHYEVEHSEVDQRVQCEICHNWFKHAYTLAAHMRRHKAAQETCKYCGHISKNRMTLRAHIRNMHSELDTGFKPRSVFPCTICGKLFGKRQTLKEHITLHTGESHLYECTFCPRTFRSSANMYAHRKKVHPREYEEKYANNKAEKKAFRGQVENFN